MHGEEFSKKKFWRVWPEEKNQWGQFQKEQLLEDWKQSGKKKNILKTESMFRKANPIPEGRMAWKQEMVKKS